MARVVGVTPAQLAEAGRDDAARVLEEMLRRATPPLAAVPGLPADDDDDEIPLPDMDAAMRAASDTHLPGIWQAIIAAAVTGPADAAGDQIFTDPAYPDEPRRWDYLVEVGLGLRPGKGFTLRQLVTLMAVGRANDDVRRAANPAARIRGVLTLT